MPDGEPSRERRHTPAWTCKNPRPAGDSTPEQGNQIPSPVAWWDCKATYSETGVEHRVLIPQQLKLGATVGSRVKRYWGAILLRDLNSAKGVEEKTQ